MNVRQLIDRLRQYPPDLEVVVKDYEWGLGEVDLCWGVVRRDDEGWFFDADYDPESGDPQVQTLSISRSQSGYDGPTIAASDS